MDRGAYAWLADAEPPSRQGLRAEGADQRDPHRDSHNPPAAKAAWEGTMNLTPYQTRSNKPAERICNVLAVHTTTVTIYIPQAYIRVSSSSLRQAVCSTPSEV